MACRGGAARRMARGVVTPEGVCMIVRLLVAAALLAGPAMAQDSKKQSQDADSGPPKRVRSILLYGQEECPSLRARKRSWSAPMPADRPIAFPSGSGTSPRTPRRPEAWTSRVETVEEVNRAGLPNSCSPVGTGGQTGCTRQMIRQWYPGAARPEGQGRAGALDFRLSFFSWVEDLHHSVVTPALSRSPAALGGRTSRIPARGRDDDRKANTCLPSQPRVEPRSRP